MSSTTIRNIAAQASVNTPVTISLSGLVKPDATVEVKAGDATAFRQNVTYIPPLDFVGQAIVECDSSDGNKVMITISVVPKPAGLTEEVKKIRIQTRQTTMTGDPVEDRHWEITSDTGKLEGPAAAYVPLRIHKIIGAGYEEGYEPEKTLLNDNEYFQGIGLGSFIQFDLGQLCDISEVSITWKSQGNFSLAISTDKKSFFKAYEGRGIGISRLILNKVQGVLLKITSQSDIMEIYHIEVKGAPITPKPTQTGAQAVLARSSQIVEPGQLVTMDGSQSRGDIIRYVWDGGVQLFNSDKAISSFVAPDVEEATTLQFSLTIVDRNGQYSKAESLVYVKPKLTHASLGSDCALALTEVAGCPDCKEEKRLMDEKQKSDIKTEVSKKKKDKSKILITCDHSLCPCQKGDFSKGHMGYIGGIDFPSSSTQSHS